MSYLHYNNFKAVVLFTLGIILMLIAQLYFTDVHAPNVSAAFELMLNQKSERLLLLWFTALIAAVLLFSASIISVKATINSFQYSYDSNPLVDLATTFVIILVSISAIYVTSKIVLGLIIISAVAFFAVDSNKK